MSERYPNLRRAQREPGPYRRRAQRPQPVGTGDFAVKLLGYSALSAVIAWTAAPTIVSGWRVATMPIEERERLEGSVYYQGCSDAEAAGAAPILQGSPGYREGMDGDGDGIACENYGG